MITTICMNLLMRNAITALEKEVGVLTRLVLNDTILPHLQLVLFKSISVGIYPDNESSG